MPFGSKFRKAAPKPAPKSDAQKQAAPKPDPKKATGHKK